MFSASRLTVRKILRTMPCMSALSDFLSRCQTVGDQAGISQARLSTILFGSGQTLNRIRAGNGLTLRVLERAQSRLDAFERERSPITFSSAAA